MMDKKYHYNLYREALNFARPNFEKYAELAAFYELEQENLPKYNSNKPWLYALNMPYATDAIDLRVASLQANDYIGEIEPLSPNDVDRVDKLNQAYQVMWREMNLDNFINDIIPISAVLGSAYTHIIFDDEKQVGGSGRKRAGRLIPYTIDTASVLIDPKALSLGEADYVCVTERITKNKIEKLYPNFNFKDAMEDQSAEDRGEVYVGNEFIEPKGDELFTRITVYEKDTNEDGLCTVHKTVLINDATVEETKDMGIRCFPIAQLRWKKKLKSPYGVGMMEMLLPIQKVVNEIESANANANMQYSAPSFVLSEDAGIDPEDLAMSSGAPGTVYVVNSGVDPNKVITSLMPNRGIDQGLVLTRQELERTIYKLASVNEQFMGATGTAGNTAQGANESIARAKIIENLFLANLEEYTEQLTRIIVEFLVVGFAGETIYTRGEKQSDNTFSFSQFDIPEDAQDLEYTYYIQLSVKTKYSKELQKSQLLELYTIERQYETNEVKGINFLDILKALDVPQTQEIVDRYKKSIQMDAEQKAQLVSEILTVAQTLGIDAQMANSAIAEVITGALETPNLDQFMQLAQQQAMQTSQAIDGTVNDLAAEQEQAAMLQAEDDEVNAPVTATMPTGDMMNGMF